MERKTAFGDFPSKRLLDGLTDQQKAALGERGRVLVSASAGSGKTTTMVRKIIAEAERGVPVSEMLILVYNEAAANELKERLHTAFFEAACAADGSMREFLRRNIDQLSSASIGTIHSFCRSLIKSNFERLGVSPAFDIIAEDMEAKYKSEAMDAVFSRCYKEGDVTFMRLADALTSSRKEDYLRDVVNTVYELVEIQPDRQGFMRRLKENYLAPDFGAYGEALAAGARRRAERWRSVLEDILPVLVSEGQKSYAAKSEAVIEALRGIRAADFPGVCRAVGDIVKTLSMSASKKRDSVSDEAETARVTLAAARTYFKNWAATFADREFLTKAHLQNAEFVGKLVDLVEMLDEEFSAAKRADDVMTYSDLEYFAAELVRNGDFRGRYSVVFVDEYQEVNPVQEFIIDSLLPDEAFMVGDVKQSIYAFRLADPEIFLGRKRRYESGKEGKALEFNANFRSVRPVLQLVNSVFDVAMTAETSGMDYLSEGHFAIGDEKKDVNGDILSGAAEVHLFSAPDEQARAYAKAVFIAEKLKQIVGKVTKENGAPISYEDCVILMRSRSAPVKRMARYLAAEGVPLDTSIFADDDDRAERELVRFLTVLDNPREDIPLAGFMLSWFGGFGEEELVLIADKRPKGGDFYDAVLAAAQEDSALGKKTARMLDMLASYRLKASFKSVPDLLQGIVSDFSYDAYVQAMGWGGTERVSAFVAEKTGKDPYMGIGRFLAAYKAAAGVKKKRKTGMGGNKVRFATYHAYKGLEAPVVFIADADHKPSSRPGRRDVMTDNRGFVGMTYFDFDCRTKKKALSLYALEEMKSESERRDELRMYYVALTRAKQYLYIMGDHDGEASFGRRKAADAPVTILDHIKEACYAGKTFAIHRHEFDDVAPDVTAAKELVLPENGRAEDIAAIRRAVGRRYPYRAATGLAMKYSVSALDGGGDEVTLGAFADRADEGIAYHKVMEHIDFAAQGREGVERELDAMVASGAITEKERAEVDADAVARCLAHPVMQLARESVCHREKSFLMYVPAKEVGAASTEDRVLVQGVIDLLIDGRERVIVDFKNSALRSAEALEKYKKQLNLYKKAVESSFSGKVDRILLYSFKTGDIVELEKEG